MKKNKIRKNILISLITITLLISFISADIYINEFEFDADGVDTGNEWVEIYNDGNPLDLTGWYITDKDSNQFFFPSVTITDFYVLDGLSAFVNGAGDQVNLFDSFGQLQDSTGLIIDDYNDNRTWQRIPDGTGSFAFKEQTKEMTNMPSNSIESSTMVFEGELNDNGDGSYSGTLDATAGNYYIPGGKGTFACTESSGYCTPDWRNAVGGWDVYAQEGGNAYYDDMFQGIIGPDHDAYSHAGGWGDFWNPDVPDWNNYQLTLNGDKWYLEFKGENLGTPMSGDIDWYNSYLFETGTGSYRGIVPNDPDANDGDAALNGGGPQAWDMDWTWGSEVIPLEYPGFEMTIEHLGWNSYRITLVPAEEPPQPPQDEGTSPEVPITPGTVSPGNEEPDVHMIKRYLDIGIDIDGSGSSINPSDIRNGFYAFTGEKVIYYTLVRDQSGAADIKDVRWIRNGNDETAMCFPVQVYNSNGQDYIEVNGDIVYIDQATNLLYDDQIDKVYRCQVEVENNWDDDDRIAVKATDQSGQSGQTLEEVWTFNPPLTIEIKTSDNQPLSFGEKELDQAVPGVRSPDCIMQIGETLANRDCENYQNLPGGVKLCDVSFSTNKLIIENKGIVSLWTFIAATDFHDSTGMATCPFDNTLPANQFEYRALQGSWDSGWRVMPEYSPNLGCNGPTGKDSCRGGCRITEGNPIDILGAGQNIQLQLKIVWPTPCIGNFNEGNIYAIVRAV